MTVLGILFGATVFLPAFLQPDLRWVGLSLVATGVATMAWWLERGRGRERPSTGVRLAGQGGLLAAVVLGFASLAADAAAALGA